MKEELVKRKADDLCNYELIATVECLDSADEYKEVYSLIDSAIENLDNYSKVLFITRLRDNLIDARKEHQYHCPEREKENPTCYIDDHYEEVLDYLVFLKKNYLSLDAESQIPRQHQPAIKQTEAETASVTRNNKSDAPSATLQKIAIYTAVILFLLKIIIDYLKDKDMF